MTAERGDWMQTFTGRRFYPVAPLPWDVDPVDIAHSLALVCRYGGHVRRFYSVAEHCVLMSRAVAPENALHALLHDATEAYVGDMVRPLKNHMAQYRRIEDRVWQAVAARFGIDPAMPDEVKAADARIIQDERAALMAPTDDPWGTDHLAPLGVWVRGWDPVTAEVAYARRLTELRGGNTA